MIEVVAYDKRSGDHRIRPCTIYYHFEDGSINVVEPKLKNSGLPQVQRDNIILYLFNLGSAYQTSQNKEK